MGLKMRLHVIGFCFIFTAVTAFCHTCLFAQENETAASVKARIRNILKNGNKSLIDGVKKPGHF